MKPFARLLLFTLVFFLLLFLAALAFCFLRLYVAAAIAIPVRPVLYLDQVVRNSWWILSFCFYTTTLFAINYAQRNGVSALPAFIAIGALSGGLTFAAASGLENTRFMYAPPFLVTSTTLGDAGLMLSKRNTVITLIDKPSVDTNKRVLSMRGQPLAYESLLPHDGVADLAEMLNPDDEDLPPARFHTENSILYYSMGYDFGASARVITGYFSGGILSFLLWFGPLFMLLFMLSYIFEVGAWPLANLFLCALVYRGILFFEVFLRTEATQRYLIDFARGLLPTPLLAPVILALLALLLFIYDVLMYFARERGKHER